MGLVETRRKALLTCVAVVVAGGSAAAQDAVGETGASQKQGRVTLLERIVVGAGVEKVAIDTPQSVSVIDQDDIDRVQAETVGDVFRAIPGVNTSGSERQMGQSFNIRGIGAPANSGEEGRIIVNVDGATKYYESYRMGSLFTDPELYKQVEVLRGPASSTLYGSGALGGIVNFTTKDALDFIEEGETGALSVKSSYSSNGNAFLQNVTLAQELTPEVNFLLTGNYRRADNYVTGAGTQVPSTLYTTWSGLAKVTANVGDEGVFRASYQRWDSQTPGLAFEQTAYNPAFGLADRHVVDSTAVVSYENPFFDNDWLDLKISASYSNTTNTVRNATGIPANTFGPHPAITCTSNILFCDTDFGYKTYQLNAQNTSEFHGESWDNYLTYGWQFAHQTRTADNLSSTSGILYHPEGKDLRNGIFVQNEFVWNDALTIMPGVRFDWRTLSPSASSGVTGDFNDTALSPKIAAHYKINDNIAIFGSFAHTERFPTIDEVFSTSNGSSTFDPSFGLKKEKSNNWEAGFALSGNDLLKDGDAAQIKTTFFHNSINDLIATNPNLAASANPLLPPVANPGLQGNVNINRARIYGLEIEGAYDSDYVFGSAAYTYTVGRDLSNNAHLTTVAPHELALTVGGRLPEHDLEFGVKSRFVMGPQDSCRNASATLSNGACTGGATSRFSQAFNVHNIFLSWKPSEGDWKGWEARAGVDNVFNANYKEFLNNDFSKARTFKVSLSKKIGL